MKFCLLFILAGFTCISSTGQARRLTGSWQGAISPGLRLVVHFTTNAKGELSATLDSPDQGAKGIPCSAVILNGDSVRVEVDVAKASYKGTVLNDSVISGVWSQGGGSAPLHLKKTSPPAALSRPQTPKAPFNYMSEEVEYDNADKTVHLGGTLTWPKGGGKFAVALLITGSGQQDRDETYLEHKPFAVLADYLTRQGIAVLRVDDRGRGKSTGEVMAATSADFAKDVEAGIRYLKTRNEIDPKKIGLIGHSEGGIIAPMVAANNKDVSFIVLWGAPVIGGLEINTEQNAYSLQKAGMSSASINAFKLLHRQQLMAFKTAVDTTALRHEVKRIFDGWRIQQPDSVLKGLYVSDDNIVGQNIYKMYSGLYNLPWMRYFITYDPKTDLAKVRCKVLAINGTLDTQVEADANLTIIDSVLRKNNNRSFKVVPLKGLNHFLQTASTGDATEYGKIEETIAPSALELMASWINEQMNAQRK